MNTRTKWRSRLMGAAIVVILANLSLSAEPDESAGELDGLWNVERLVIDGIELPVSKSPDPCYFQINGQLWRYYFVVSGKPALAEFLISLDNQESPSHLDAKLLKGPLEGKVCKGIIQKTEETITFCLAEDPSAARPQKLESKTGSGRQLFVMRRVTREVDPAQ